MRRSMPRPSLRPHGPESLLRRSLVVVHARPQAYPAVLLLTSLGDSRVPSWQSGKMAAALQAATTSGRPVLLRVDEAAGHMPATFTDEQRRQDLADVYAFTMAMSGMPEYRPPTGGVQGPARTGLLIPNLRLLFDVATGTFSAPTVFEMNVEASTKGANAFNSLGDAFLARGDRTAARDAFARAVLLAEKHNDPMLSQFRKKLDSVNQK
jgi:hypothetical protein